MRKTAFHFECQESLAKLLARADGHELPLSCSKELVDGDWLLVGFSVAGVTASLPGRVVRNSDDAELCVEFSEREWERLLELAACEEAESQPPPSRQTPPETATPPPGTEVLLVNDDPEVSSLLSRMLRQSGFSVTCAASADEAGTHARRTRPHIVLADWDPTDPSGSALTDVLAPKGGKKPSLVFLACPSRRADRERALAAGADDFVVLPFRWRELGVRLLSLAER